MTDSIHFFTWWAWTQNSEKRASPTTDKCSRRETLQFTSFALCTNCVKFWTLPYQKANYHQPAWVFSFHPASVLFSKTFLLPSRLGKIKPRLLLQSIFPPWGTWKLLPRGMNLTPINCAIKMPLCCCNAVDFTQNLLKMLQGWTLWYWDTVW